MARDTLTETFTLVDGYDKSSNQTRNLYRWMTIPEAQSLTSHTLEIRAKDGTARRVTLNGRPRTWKSARNANRVEVPLKYGMYEYATFTNQPDGRVGNGVSYLVVRVISQIP
jgi:hypothetical protein